MAFPPLWAYATAFFRRPSGAVASAAVAGKGRRLAAGAGVDAGRPPAAAAIRAGAGRGGARSAMRLLRAGASEEALRFGGHGGLGAGREGSHSEAPVGGKTRILPVRTVSGLNAAAVFAAFSFKPPA